MVGPVLHNIAYSYDKGRLHGRLDLELTKTLIEAEWRIYVSVN